MTGIHTPVAQDTFTLIVCKKFIGVVHTVLVAFALEAGDLHAVLEAIFLQFTVTVGLTGETVCPMVGEQKV